MLLSHGFVPAYPSNVLMRLLGGVTAASVTARIYRLRGVLVAPPILAAALTRVGDVDHLAITWSVGLALFAAGWIVRLWAQCHLAYRMRRRDALTSCGPYAYVRNPLYLANGTMAIGAVVASETLWLVPVTLLWYAIIYGFVVRHEERSLSAHYGAGYARYALEVPRWLPARPVHASSCVHDAFRPALFAELHTPLIMAPAVMKSIVILGPPLT